MHQMHPTLFTTHALNQLRRGYRIVGTRAIGNPDFYGRRRMRVGAVDQSLEDAVTQDQAAIDAIDATVAGFRDAIANIGVDENGNATDTSMQPIVDGFMQNISDALAQRANAVAALNADKAALLAAQNQPMPGGANLPGFTPPAPGQAPPPNAPPPIVPSTPSPVVVAPAKKMSTTKLVVGGLALAGLGYVGYEEFGKKH